MKSRKAFCKLALFNADHEITLINNGNTDLWFYIGSSKKAQPGDVKVIVAQQSNQIVKVSDLGIPADAHFLAYNPKMNKQVILF